MKRFFIILAMIIALPAFAMKKATIFNNSHEYQMYITYEVCKQGGSPHNCKPGNQINIPNKMQGKHFKSIEYDNDQFILITRVDAYNNFHGEINSTFGTFDSNDKITGAFCTAASKLGERQYNAVILDDMGSNQTIVCTSALISPVLD